MAPPGTKKKNELASVKLKGEAMAPPGMNDEPDSKAPPGDGKKHSVEDAHKVSENQHCKDCSNYEPTTGDCSEVDGYWEPEDACVRYFEPLGGSGDQGGEEGTPDTPTGDGEASAQ